MRRGEAGGQSSVVSEMLRASEVGVDCLTWLCNSVTQERLTYQKIGGGMLVPVYKEKVIHLSVGLIEHFNF